MSLKTEEFVSSPKTDDTWFAGAGTTSRAPVGLAATHPRDSWLAETRATEPRLESGQVVFHAAWGFYGLVLFLSEYFEWFQFSHPEPWLIYLPLGLLSIWTIVKPDSLWPATALATHFLIIYWLKLPHLNNHATLTLVASLTVLIAYGLALSRRPLGAGSSTWQVLRSLLAFELLTMYFFVVWHKLNRDFFDPQHSCAVVMFNDVDALWGNLLPDATSIRLLGPALIAFTLISEIAIPILLVFSSTRRVAMLYGFVFHSLLMLHPNVFIMGYSTVVMALYMLFLAPAVADSLSEALLRRRTMFLLSLLGWGALWAAVVATRAWQAGTLNRAGLISSLHHDAAYFLRISWIAAHTLLAFIVYRTYAKTPSAETNRVCRFCSLVHPAAFAVLLMTINGWAPYLGLYSGHSWSMFSNLKSEGEHTNHLLIPSSARLFNFLSDTYHVHDSSEPELKELGTGGSHILTLHDIRRLLNKNPKPDRFVVLAKPGEEPARISYQDQPEHEVFQPLLAFADKVFKSRRVPAGPTPCPCSH